MSRKEALYKQLVPPALECVCVELYFGKCKICEIMHIMFAYMGCQETEYYKVYKKYCSIVASKKFSVYIFCYTFLGGGGGGLQKGILPWMPKSLVWPCACGPFSQLIQDHICI